MILRGQRVDDDDTYIADAFIHWHNWLKASKEIFWMHLFSCSSKTAINALCELSLCLFQRASWRPRMSLRFGCFAYCRSRSDVRLKLELWSNLRTDTIQLSSFRRGTCEEPFPVYVNRMTFQLSSMFSIFKGFHILWNSASESRNREFSSWEIKHYETDVVTSIALVSHSHYTMMKECHIHCCTWRWREKFDFCSTSPLSHSQRHE